MIPRGARSAPRLLAPRRRCVGAGTANRPSPRFASVAGTVEVQRAGKGEWQAAAVGQPGVRRGCGAHRGRRVRQAAVRRRRRGRPRTVAAELTIERYAAAAKGAARVAAASRPGRARGVVGGYSGEGARYEIETPTAVVRVQSTDFIVPLRPAEKATDVVGVDGTVTVQGTHRHHRTGRGGRSQRDDRGAARRLSQPGPCARRRPGDQPSSRAAAWSAPAVAEGLDTDNPIVEGRVVDRERPSAAAAAGAPASAGLYLQPRCPRADADRQPLAPTSAPTTSPCRTTAPSRPTNPPTRRAERPCRSPADAPLSATGGASPLQQRQASTISRDSGHSGGVSRSISGHSPFCCTTRGNGCSGVGAPWYGPCL